MQKRYILSPILLLVVVVTWNVALGQKPASVSAEDLQPFINPKITDERFPVEVFTVGVDGGATQSAVLANLPTKIYPEDKVTFVGPDPGYGLGTIVHIQRAALVKIKDGRRSIEKRTFDTTVGELLKDLRRPLEGLDRVDVGANTKIQPGMTVNVTRVAKVQRSVTSSEPFEVQTKDDANTDRGTEKVTQEGQNGVRTKVYEDTREDGEVVKTVMLSNKVTTAPKTKIVSKGTRIRYGRNQSGKATWYDLCCKKVASNNFKKGTWVEVTAVSTGKKIEVQVDDTGAFGADVAIDLHPSYFTQLGFTKGQGTGQVIVKEVLNPAT